MKTSNTRIRVKIMLTTALMVGGLALWMGSAPSENARALRARHLRYEVTLTNITRGQIFSPAVVYTHTRAMKPLFMPGQPASPEVAGVAEDAMLDPLVESLSNSANVRKVAVLTGAEGPILPGETATIIIEGSHWASQVSLMGMLVSTNDAFYGINGARAPMAGSKAYQLPAYDAGSEANTERCEHIPGPPCGHGGVRVTEGAEGYVHIHAGIHGIGDLEPTEADWNNPVALLKVRKLGARE